jgi:hypothetical protein
MLAEEEEEEEERKRRSSTAHTGCASSSRVSKTTGPFKPSTPLTFVTSKCPGDKAMDCKP